ncbi:hypothetical protein L7F22_052988 [Adiantum nelumboides]|nr:hypothetical protein [Adiantum nelumboides]
MEDLWKRAKSFAEEAAKKSQTLTNSAKITDLVSKRQAIPRLSSLSIVNSASASAVEPPSPSELKSSESRRSQRLRQGLTSDTFKHFRSKQMCVVRVVSDAAEEVSEVPTTASNVRKDLTEWQEKHATFVLTTVKVRISRLRYELCPRVMKERRFWKIYFTLVSSHVAPYEKQYMEEMKVKETEQLKDDTVKPTPVVGGTDQAEGSEKKK